MSHTVLHTHWRVRAPILSVACAPRPPGKFSAGDQAWLLRLATTAFFGGVLCCDRIVAAVLLQVGMDSEGELVINPEMAVAAMSPLNLTIAGTA